MQSAEEEVKKPPRCCYVSRGTKRREHGKFTSLNEVCFLEPSGPRRLIAPRRPSPLPEGSDKLLSLSDGVSALRDAWRTMAVEPSVGALYSLKRSKKW